MTKQAIAFELTERLEAADGHELVEGVRGVADRLGERAGVAIETFGRATAVVCRCLETSLYNRVVGFDAEGLGSLDDILDFYREHDTPPRFDIVPHQCSKELEAALTERGFQRRTRPIFSNLLMYRSTTMDIPPLPDGVVVREVAPHEAELLGRIHASGLGYGEPVRSHLGLQLESRLSDPDAYGFLALIDGQPAGTGLLSTLDGIGYFGHASTLPSFRGRGAQIALLNARIAKAAQLGCDHLATFPVPGSVSERNVRRCGFDLAHRMDIWMDIEVEGE